MVSRCTGGHFGGRAVELAGVVVHPRAQAHDVGTRMVKSYMSSQESKLVTAHTRNPAILRMLGRVCGEHSVYPLNQSQAHRELAMQIPDASLASDGAVYHIKRYGDDGLYGNGDPADRRINATQTLKERFTGLNDPGTALVVIAEVATEGVQ